MAARRILQDLPAAAVVALVSIGFGQFILNGWLWFAALMAMYLVGKEI